MLQLTNVTKCYRTGETVFAALDRVSITLRDNEFVSVLGPSGSGKTTLLNVIGGLDRYDSGDLLIDGVSTKDYSDRDWDTYRNHTVGFVFQSYNLIPHQSVLSNVELALTIGGVGRAERRERAAQALREVGLGDQLDKLPSQLSGGQMQRVAIARALVNNPSVLLADEPTGALDSETSLQVMELLRRVAQNRLVVMVTHNAEIAQEYSTRIVRLCDGRVTSDSNPFDPAAPAASPTAAPAGAPTDPAAGPAPAPAATTASPKPSKQARMSFWTSLGLSFNNLRTKKGRTILTALAGSIGIVGIAMILALSTGANRYIADTQREAMASYPITISASSIDLSGLVASIDATDSNDAGASATRTTSSSSAGKSGTAGDIRIDYGQLEADRVWTASMSRNDLAAFKAFLDDPSNEIHRYLGQAGIRYTYDVSFSAYAHDPSGTLVDTSSNVGDMVDQALGGGFASLLSSASLGSSLGSSLGGAGALTSMFGLGMGGSQTPVNFCEIPADMDGTSISQSTLDSYDVLSGRWPESFDEVVLVVSRSGTLPADTLCQLGVFSASDYYEAQEAISAGEEPLAHSWTYEDLMGLAFYMVPASYHYVPSGLDNGTFRRLDLAIPADQEALLENAVELKVVGVVRRTPSANDASLSGAVAYSPLLTSYIISSTESSPVIVAQKATPQTDVLTGRSFEASTPEEKAEEARKYISGLGVSDKASLYLMIQLYQSTGMMADVGAASGSTGATSGSTATGGSIAGLLGMGATLMSDESTQAALLDRWLDGSPDTDVLLTVYEEVLAGGSYEENMAAFGEVSFDNPSSISIYADSFEAKEAISTRIEEYNDSVPAEQRIVYTDLMSLVTSSITSIIDAISFLLIAFVAVSLVVTCIMIGIITHISVLERTKEIGILRALGASKRNISQVFNAETTLLGLASGILGIVIALLLTIPANLLIAVLAGTSDLHAVLPLSSGLILIAISIGITVLGGLIPASSAAKRDPAAALRAE